MTVEEAIDREIVDKGETIVELAARLVSAPSMNPPGHTLDVARVVGGFLQDAGLAVETVSTDPQAPNLVTEIPMATPGRHVVFNAHMDTMQPGSLAAWSVPPMELTRREGKLFGLGMGNMKGALAAMCVATTVLARHSANLSGRLAMTAVCDEVMFGERGAVHLLRARPDLAGDCLISGEGPGYMGLSVAEKGLLWLDVEATGEGGHSSKALAGDTAAARLAAFLVAVDQLNLRFSDVPEALEGISGGEGNLGLRLSCNIGTVSAGGVRSLVAPNAKAELDFRLPPGLSAATVETQVRDLAGAIGGIEIRVAKAWDANWTAIDDPLTATVSKIADRVRGGQPAYVVRLPGSDARRWRELGTPAICFGPQPTLSAGADDHVDEKDLIDCARIYALAAARLMRPA